MKAQRVLLLAVTSVAALSGCGERAPGDLDPQGSTTPAYERVESESLFSDTVTPVRIGELGPGFAACNSIGTTRDRVTTAPMPVRAAPFEQAMAIDELAAGARFFICSRTNDQRWFGVVYDEGGEAAERCGVSDPVPSRQYYRGPCAAGWVSSTATRLISGARNEIPSESKAE